MHAGTEATYPKHASQGAKREMKDAAPYHDLVKHYLNGRAAQFDELLAASENDFKRDGTLGLLKQMRGRMAARAVSTQTRTFLARSLAAVAADAGLPGADAAKQLIATCARRAARRCSCCVRSLGAAAHAVPGWRSRM